MADSVDRVGGIQSSHLLQGGGNDAGKPANNASQKATQKAAGDTGVRLQLTIKASGPGSAQGVSSKHSAAAATDALNAYLASTNHQLRFRLDKASGDVVVSVVDLKNNKVIRQLPPEDVLKLAAALRKMGRIDTTGLRSQA